MAPLVGLEPTTYRLTAIFLILCNFWYPEKEKNIFLFNIDFSIFSYYNFSILSKRKSLRKEVYIQWVT